MNFTIYVSCYRYFFLGYQEIRLLGKIRLLCLAGQMHLRGDTLKRWAAVVEIACSIIDEVLKVKFGFYVINIDTLLFFESRTFQ